jgi:hypothetical protein
VTFTQRCLSTLLVATGIVPLLPAQEPHSAPKPFGTASVSSGLVGDQQLADSIARTLKESGRLARYRVDIQVNDGDVELTGSVADWLQHQEALRLTREVPGVIRVRDRLAVVKEGAIMRVQAVPMPEEGPDPKKMAPQQGGAGEGPSLPPVGQMPPQDPTPISQIPAHDPLLQPPPMPPYAWPTYAPYNNLSRVAYPNLYPYEAFPFIGPFYPFPKVPPGWRSVSLTWNDGFWWYGKNACGHDWWRIRYR